MQSGFWWQLEISKLLLEFMRRVKKKNVTEYYTMDGENKYYLTKGTMKLDSQDITQYLWLEEKDLVNVTKKEELFIWIGDCGKFDEYFTFDGEIDELVIAPKNEKGEIEYHYNN